MSTKRIEAVLIRHAQSLWNRENRFTGWADPPLTAAGIQEAVDAGDLLARQGWHFDFAFTSRLKRARQTLSILEQRLGTALPRREEWRLNERHYGVLQGRNKEEMAAQVGAEQVWRWRRGYHDSPAALATDDPDHPIHHPRYADVPRHLLPGVESLADTRRRVSEFWLEEAAPRIETGQRLLISAHGNTLRALLMALTDMTVAEVERFEIPTATPIVCTFDERARLLRWRYLAPEPARRSG